MPQPELDLTPLRQCLASLEDGLDVVRDADWFNPQSDEVRHTLITGVGMSAHEVRMFGSRARGTPKPYSDLALVIMDAPYPWLNGGNCEKHLPTLICHGGSIWWTGPPPRQNSESILATTASH